MAITKIHAVKVRLGDAINYIENPDKTDGQELISGYNTAPQTAVLDFSVTAAMAHKARNTSAKKKGNLAYHLIQSFSPDDAVTPELAHKLGRKLAMEFTEGKFEFVVATHIDKDSIHNHIIINAVSFYDYKKLRTVPYRTAQQIRSISDQLCMEAQLSVIKDPQQLGRLYPTYVQKKRTTSNRTEVRKKLNFCLERATNYAQFLQMAQELDISVCQRGKHIHTAPDGAITADIGAAFSYDITYDDGTHGTIRGTDLIRQIDEENLTQPLIVSLTADHVMAMSLRGVTVHLPQYGIERLFIPEHYVQRNVEQGSCAISLYPGWQYSYVPTGSEKTRKAISGADLAQSLGGVVQTGTSESNLARRVSNVERRAGIANAQELGKLLGSMADNGLHSAADFDKQISAYQREETKLRNEIAELRSKSKTYAATAHNLQVCHTYKSVWLEYASKPLAQKDTFYKQNEAALQAYSRAASQLEKMGISQDIELEKVKQLVSKTETRISNLIGKLEKVQESNHSIQEDKEKVERIQGS